MLIGPQIIDYPRFGCYGGSSGGFVAVILRMVREGIYLCSCGCFATGMIIRLSVMDPSPSITGCEIYVFGRRGRSGTNSARGRLGRTGWFLPGIHEDSRSHVTRAC